MPARVNNDPMIAKDRDFWRRLGTYLFGVAIGFVLLGWFQMHRQRAIQAQRADREARQVERQAEWQESPPPQSVNPAPGGAQAPAVANPAEPGDEPAAAGGGGG